MKMLVNRVPKKCWKVASEEEEQEKEEGVKDGRRHEKDEHYCMDRQKENKKKWQKVAKQAMDHFGLQS